MRTELRLRQKMEELQMQWDLLSEQLFSLNRKKILATDPEEEISFKYRIQERDAERKQIEERLRKLEKELAVEGPINVNTFSVEIQTGREHKKVKIAPKQEEFEFEVVIVNKRGETIRRERGKACQHIEDIDNKVIWRWLLSLMENS